MIYSPPVALVEMRLVTTCHECGSLVRYQELHDEWHQKKEEK